MGFPDYFANIPTITLRDPLADLLGAAEGGLLDYRFEDAVRLAGHSCPTVAGAWLMTIRALRVLYGDAVPERGNITVAMGEAQDSGVAGVIGSIATLITGAAGNGGFKGLGGRYSRRNLLQFGMNGVTGLRFSRLDTHATVDCELRLNSVPADPQMSVLLSAILNNQADASTTRRFGELWQGRVKRILIDHFDDPAIVRLEFSQGIPS